MDRRRLADNSDLKNLTPVGIISGRGDFYTEIVVRQPSPVFDNYFALFCLSKYFLKNSI